ncbi:uncharacterized protein LOC127291636 [Leptopilina boulardi]|uniref:uncharacterized protein LOC127291636 n=1 Tax=Leptopilina boulardi TaxID=63433 RepID=UPI0021F614FE|nr:uncharacterized protein LOC127291636 [Leptopilina boulardi]
MKRGAGMQVSNDRLKWVDFDKAFDNRLQTSAIINLDYKDVNEFSPIKVYTVLVAKFKKDSNDGKEEFDLKSFIAKTEEILMTTHLDEWYNVNVKQPTLKKIEEFQEKDSNWNLESIHRIEFPVALKDIAKFEDLNNNISVNVYGLSKRNENFSVYPLHLTKQKRVGHVNLLRIEDHYIDESLSEKEEEDEQSIISFNYHYVWIKDLSRLIGSQLSKKKSKKYICDRCLHYFGDELKFFEHEENCRKMNDTKIRLPQQGKNTIEFKNFQNKERIPFIIYADCESLLIPVETPQETNKTEVFQNHKLLSIGYYLKCAFDDSLSVYSASPIDEEDPAKWFSKELKDLSNNLDTRFKNPVPIEILTPQQMAAFRNDNTCHICKKKIAHGEVKVRDHCHLTEKFRGPAHQECNINYHESQTIRVVFHNLSGYDAHFIIEAIATEFDGKVDLLPINKEKYISFTKNIKNSFVKFRFIDSFKFMASSLDKLASYLDEYKIVNSIFSNYSDDKIQLLTRKGVFPYEYIDSREKLVETQLPPKKNFYSTLNDSNVSDEDYAHAQNVWNEFNCQNLGEYVYLYMKTDILLLADIFENFRDQCLNAYGLDAAHYYTTPGLTWDAMLKYTNVRLELLTDIDMVMYIERGIRGGVSQCTNRYAKANNPYMEKFNDKKETSYIVYFDANNLYGWAMVQSLPYGGFEWVENVNNSFDFNVPDDAPFGYILEVDLDYPNELHEKHSDFPFCPERMLMDVKLVTKWEGRYGAEALISKPNFHSRTIFNENLVAVELKKIEVFMNKPLYIGLSVLDISKTLMYDFHYDYMLQKYDEKKCKFLYTDTDSLIYEIKCSDVYADMKIDIHKFDTSDYPVNNVYGIPQANKKMLGLMKDECSGKIVTEFVGLRSKMYSVRVENQDFIKKAKGVKSSVVKKTITFDDYISKLHNVYTLKESKIALSPYDDKRFLLANSTDTLAWGHCKIREIMDDDEPM